MSPATKSFIASRIKSLWFFLLALTCFLAAYNWRDVRKWFQRQPEIRYVHVPVPEKPKQRKPAPKAEIRTVIVREQPQPVLVVVATPTPTPPPIAIATPYNPRTPSGGYVRVPERPPAKE